MKALKAPSGKLTPIQLTRNTAASTMRRGTAPTIIDFENRSLERKRQLLFSPATNNSKYTAPEFLGHESPKFGADYHLAPTSIDVPRKRDILSVLGPRKQMPNSTTAKKLDLISQICRENSIKKAPADRIKLQCLPQVPRV